MTKPRIKQLCEVRSTEEANQLLNTGWIFVRLVVRFDDPVYILGNHESKEELEKKASRIASETARVQGWVADKVKQQRKRAQGKAT